MNYIAFMLLKFKDNLSGYSFKSDFNYTLKLFFEVAQN